MNRIDLVDRLVPSPKSTIVIETGSDLYLIDTDRKPKPSDLILDGDDNIRPYDPKHFCVGVAYCHIQFLA